MPETRGLRDRRVHLLLSGMLLAAAAIFAVAGDAPHTFLLVGAGLLGSGLLRRPLERTQRTFIYMGLAAFVITVISDQLLPVNPRRFFLMPAEVYCPAVLFIGVAATYFDARESNITAVVGLSLVATMMAGNVVGIPEPGTRLLLFGTWFSERFHLFYGVAVLLQLGTMLLLLPRVPAVAPQGAECTTGSWGRRLVLGCAVALSIAGVIGLRSAAFHYERRLQRAMAQWFQRYAYRQRNWIVFGDEVDLWRTVPHLRRQDKTIVLRAQGARPPGYLRGHAFHTYRYGRWSGSTTSINLPALLPDEHLAFQVFERFPPLRTRRIRTHEAPPERVSIYPAPEFRSRVLLAPGTSEQIELVAENLGHNDDGVLTPLDWQERVGYVLRLQPPPENDNTAYQGPDITGDQAEHYLQVPARLQPALEDVATRVFATIPNTAGSEEHIRSLIAYFAAHFSYELGVRMALREGDPVIQFLNDHRRGHCELFASAAVLLLRAREIPARYVTGFVCAEAHPSGEYWVARLEDAHAWAEAYVPELGRWVTVEATPAAGIPNSESDFGLLRAPLDRLSLAWQHLWSLMKRGYVAQAIVTVATWLFSGLWRAMRHPVGAPLLLGIVICAVWILRRRRLQRLDANRDDLPPSRLELRQVYARICTSLPAIGITPPKHATPLQLAAHLRNHSDLETVSALAALLDRYLPLRYRAVPPDPEDVSRMRQEATTLLRKARSEARRKRRRNSSARRET